MDVVGGFAIQKVTPGRSYFRTIARMDVKLDFVPPALINFIARQLIGSGFRLYEKIVTSALKNDDDFREALATPLYVGIRKAFFSSGNDEPNGIMEQSDGPNGIMEQSDGPNGIMEQSDEPNGVMEQSELISDTFSLPEEQDGLEDVKHEEEEEHGSESSEKSVLPTARKTFGEIVEEESSDDITPETETCMSGEQALTGATHDEKCYVNGYTRFPVSPKVEQALGTLDRVIDLVQKSRVTSRFASVESSNLDEREMKLKPSEEGKVYPNDDVCEEVSKKEEEQKSLPEPGNGSSIRSSETRESNLHRIAPESADHNLINPIVASPSFTNVMTEAPIPVKVVHERKHVNGDANVIEKKGAKSGQRTKQRLCCF